ncbi:DUF4352 domain-containing protein [Streptomonospora halophila]|uniref:DUF4352 domain-containing protein n=1 Tax=Streptomonospora halophila TaxID=427369 RepID=A0ABP9G9G9_9ACTN
MSYNVPPPPPPIHSRPQRSGGLTTGSKIGLGCGIAAIVGFVLLVGGCMAVIVAAPGGDAVEPKTPPQADGGTGAEPTEGGSSGGDDEPAALGDAVESGAFSFTVTDVQTGVMEVTDESGFLTETPDGQYVVVSVTVQNVGDEAGYFDSGSQTLVDVEGKEYSTDTAAEITGGAESFLNEINPGNTVDGELVFDVPQGVQLDTLELRGFVSFDDSAVVDLSGV